MAIFHAPGTSISALAFDWAGARLAGACGRAAHVWSNLPGVRLNVGMPLRALTPQIKRQQRELASATGLRKARQSEGKCGVGHGACVGDGYVGMCVVCVYIAF